MISLYYQLGTEQPTSIEFSASQHRTVSDFRITGMELLSRNFTPSESIHSDDDLLIRINLKSSRLFENVFIGLEIHREGVLLSNTCIDGVVIDKSKTKSLIRIRVVSLGLATTKYI